jgi:hypothetical protein
MALLWLKPLATRVVEDSENTASVANITSPIKAEGAA